MYQIHSHLAADDDAVEALLDRAFGPGRKAKTSYRYRDGVAPIADLGFTAWNGPRLVGTIRYWPVALSETDALLLGPLAVAPECQGSGLGGALIRHSLRAAEQKGFENVVLVGDEPYYRRFGFVHAAKMGVVMPDENPARVLATALRPLAAGVYPAQSTQTRVAGSSSSRFSPISSPQVAQ